jgi:hypothetical protein
MGEFLLSILGFDPHNRHLIYTREIYRSRWSTGDAVLISNPNPKRKTTHQYYRVYNKFYPVEVLHELVRRQDPNVIDKNGYTRNQRILEDTQIVAAMAQGKSTAELAQYYGWHPEAIKLAVTRHRAREYAVREATPVLEEAELDQSPLANQPLPPDQMAKLNAMLDAWGMNED